MSNAKPKWFDCVTYMRQIRDRISDEIGDMAYEELTQWLRAHKYSDQTLQRFAEKVTPRASGATQTPHRR